MERVFLDANVLFSAAYQDRAGLTKLWRLARVRLVTSAYAAAEARANLDTVDRRERLERLLASVDVMAESADEVALPRDVYLPPKDLPILQAAIHAGAAYLITGDARHFGAYYGKTVLGVTILPPADYLRRRS